MRVGWIDGTAGASGDMLLGALVDAGVPIEIIGTAIDRLGLEIELRHETVHRAGLAATKVHVDVGESQTLRHLPDIVELLSRLDEPVRSRATATFERLARAEADVHATSIDDVHFHEVGALDSVADVVGVCAGLVELDLGGLHASTLSVGSGTTRGAHGPIPVPAPAVLRVLDGIAPVAAGPAPYEATTPTGAALLAEWVDTWGPMPEIVVDVVGGGAGTKDSDAVANICRLVLGTPVTGSATPALVQIEANVDDLDPRVWPRAIDAVLEAGALDCWVTPIVMKKGRPAHTFAALCSTGAVDAVEASIFRQTSTIGVRRHLVDRTVLERSESTVDVDGHAIRVKVAGHRGVEVNRSVEWDDVIAAADALGLSANDVLLRATRAT
ncbi:MAG: nickel pincer cofactor biosynthesis protein LarC [Ilumatobacter sp.]